MKRKSLFLALCAISLSLMACNEKSTESKNGSETKAVQEVKKTPTLLELVKAYEKGGDIPAGSLVDYDDESQYIAEGNASKEELEEVQKLVDYTDMEVVSRLTKVSVGGTEVRFYKGSEFSDCFYADRKNGGKWERVCEIYDRNQDEFDVKYVAGEKGVYAVKKDSKSIHVYKLPTEKGSVPYIKEVLRFREDTSSVSGELASFIPHSELKKISSMGAYDFTKNDSFYTNYDQFPSQKKEVTLGGATMLILESGMGIISSKSWGNENFFRLESITSADGKSADFEPADFDAYLFYDYNGPKVILRKYTPTSTGNAFVIIDLKSLETVFEGEKKPAYKLTKVLMPETAQDLSSYATNLTRTYKDCTSFLTEGNVKYLAENLCVDESDKLWVPASSDTWGLHDQGFTIAHEKDFLPYLLVKNGFISSRKPYLFEQNARVKQIKVTGSESDISYFIDVADTKDPQILDISFLSADDDVVIRIWDKYEGSKYQDLCLSLCVTYPNKTVQ